MASKSPPSFLTIPCELRNVVYFHIFSPEPTYELSTYNEPRDPIAAALKAQFADDNSTPEPCSPRYLRVLETCEQVHREAHLLALSLTGFHVVGEAAYPQCFAARSSRMRDGKLGAIRHLTLTARISQLRAMNESWNGLPFGNASLDLETLTIVPKRPDASYSAYAHVADLSQGHTLAHIFAETFKGLRNVTVVHVKNRGCFNQDVWRRVYISLLLRMMRWGGMNCGIRFQSCNMDEPPGEEWFKVWLKDGEEGNEVGDEARRVVPASGQIPTLAVV